MDPANLWYVFSNVLDILAVYGYGISDEHREALEELWIVIMGSG